MDAQEIAQRIQDENGSWMISQMGSDDLGDLIWDVYPQYQKMSPGERASVCESVGRELFG